jgi:hypothetical protein
LLIKNFESVDFPAPGLPMIPMSTRSVESERKL